MRTACNAGCDMAGVAGLVILREHQGRRVSGQAPCLNRSKRPLQWPDLDEDQRKRFDRFNATASSQLSSPDGGAAIPREPRKFLLCCPAPCCAGVRLRSSPAGRSPSRPQWCGLGNGKRRLTMATIGTFKKTGSNEFTGDIVTLSVQAKGVRITPDLRATGDNAPSHRVLVGRAEIGAACSKRSNEGRDYLGLKLDDPSFNAPIYANLFDEEDGETFSLIWSRPNGRRSD